MGRGVVVACRTAFSNVTGLRATGFLLNYTSRAGSAWRAAPAVQLVGAEWILSNA